MIIHDLKQAHKSDTTKRSAIIFLKIYEIIHVHYTLHVFSHMPFQCQFN